MATKQITIPIVGMTCASCAAHIEGGLKNLSGIEKATVNLGSGKASIEYDPARVSPQKMFDTIVDVGYQVGTAQATLHVTGMTCASCVEACIDGQEILLGNRKLMKQRGVDITTMLPQAERLEHEGKTVMFVAVARGHSLCSIPVESDPLPVPNHRAQVDSEMRQELPAWSLGLIAVADTLKEHSVEAIRQLHKLGMETVMLTGDNARTAAAIARQVGIDRVFSEVLPQDKANEVKKLQGQGKKVAMVGDGVNDAPALAQADVGMAIGSGTDLAKETGHVILIKDDLRDVVVAIEVAKATMRKVKQNLFWAFIYNTLGIPIAAGLLYPFFQVVISPEIAAALMAISSLTVTLNTLLLRGFTPTLKRGRGAGGVNPRERAPQPVLTTAPVVSGGAE